MERLSAKAIDDARASQEHLLAAARSLRLLSSVSWPIEVREIFLRTGRLPPIDYPDVDVSGALEAIATARKQIVGEHVVLAWLRRIADKFETTAHLMRSRGTAEFFEHSKRLFGEPKAVMIDRRTRTIDFARHMDAVLGDSCMALVVMADDDPQMDAAAFAARLRPLLAEEFQTAAPRVELSSEISAKAAAGRTRIRVREDASFTRRDVYQLLQHEALVHVATALNGRSQASFPILGSAHAGTTQTQEGLAVFAELISGAMDPNRFGRLADRVIAIQNAIEGADFNQIFEFFVERTGDRAEAFENARRIVRGGTPGGGAPFTKDSVYLNGLLRIHNFLRSAVSLKRVDLIRILFAGKMDIEDVPALAALANEGLLAYPQHMPGWARDLRFLVSYLAYSGFLNQVGLPGFQSYYQDQLEDVPQVWT